MAEQPPKENSGATAGGTVLGVIVGLPSGVFASLVVLGNSPVLSCAGAIAFGAVGVVVLALLAWATWIVCFRRRGSAAIGFLRGVLVSVTLFLLIPWPCSLSWAGFFAAAGACARH